MTANPSKWIGMKYPDSDLVSLVFRHARPAEKGLLAVDVGCGSGRHLRLLEDVGYRAVGIDGDPAMCEQARANGYPAECCDARLWRPAEEVALAVCWGFMMLLPDGPQLVASWRPGMVIADWRSTANSCCAWPGNVPLGGGRMRLHNVGHMLDGQEYCFHELNQCNVPGYRRIAWQRVSKQTDIEINEWIQTVHVREE